MRVEILIHPTCATSYKVVKHLHSKRLLGKAELAPTSSPRHAFRARVWSVPWIIVDGIPAATDPVTPEEVESIILEGKAEIPRDPVKAFMEAVLHSAYAASVAVVHGSINPVLDEDLASAALRTPLGGPSPGQLRIHDTVYMEWSNMLVRALAISLVRELWWATRGSPPSLVELGNLEAIAGTWLLAKASIGRAGLPGDPSSREVKGAGELAEFLSKTYNSLVKRVEREQKMILGDKEYWRLIEDLGLN
ncbi:MAG: hypothetical protein F7C08_02485 [Desulfurococcales archaeon]|nr:hypothetical protein [Desulfurococcales archaeon]MCE4605386.1 hypothetical protein [Desulfurococcales archaeon]